MFRPEGHPWHWCARLANYEFWCHCKHKIFNQW